MLFRSLPEKDARLPENSYRVSELCAIVHDQGARVLARYGRDFYRGTPALTVNDFGKGKAYYLAARTDLAFLRDFYEIISRDLALPRALDKPLPQGVIATRRQGEEQDFVFLQNYGKEEQMLSLPDGFTDALTGAPVSAVSLPGFGVAVLCTTGTLAE